MESSQNSAASGAFARWLHHRYVPVEPPSDSRRIVSHNILLLKCCELHYTESFICDNVLSVKH